jgi:hypothetical protein
LLGLVINNSGGSTTLTAATLSCQQTIWFQLMALLIVELSNLVAKSQ